MATEAQIRNWLERSIEAIAAERPQLRIDSIGERALCFRLGLHLSGLVLENLIVDSEYNFDLSGPDSKRVPNIGRLAELARTQTNNTLRLVIPDLILHRRTEIQTDNEAVIEVKMSDAADLDAQFAREKVIAIRSRYGYVHAIVVTLPRDAVNFARNCRIEFIPIT